MKAKTIRKQITLSMIVVLLLFFAIATGYSVYESMAMQNLMSNELNEYFELLEEVLEESAATSPAARKLLSNEVGGRVENHIFESERRIAICYVITAVVLVVLVLVYSRRTANRIVEPIEQLEAQMKCVGGGDFNKEAKIEDAPREIEGLVGCYNVMLASLRDYLEQLKKTTSDKDRLTTELTLMRQIQANMLPSRYPTLNSLVMHADAWRLSELGVSFYDFFAVDESRIAMIIGDVTDEGVMATLYAVISQNYIRGFAKMGYPPSRILAETNNLLSEKNQFGLNVGVTVAVIDHMTGEMSYATAGGEPPILRQAGSAAVPVSDQMTIPLGNMENVVYHTYKTQLAQGDTLALYSHGVITAKNASGEIFGMDRLKDAVEARIGYDLSEASEEIHSRIRDFTADVPQTDDGMLLLVRYLG